MLNARLGGRLLVKAEALQRTGSFKVRGAFNKIRQLDDAARAAGVAAFSSGNHAQAVALAAAELGAPAVIVMPSNAPAIKAENTRAYGADIVPYDRVREDREAIARAVAEARGATLVRPFDDPEIIAGQGTIGLEIAEQTRELVLGPVETLDVLLVPCSGGGLIAGCALALADASPGTAIYAVEPEGFDDTARSLAAGERRSNDPSAAPGGSSICDALLTPTPGALTFAINARRLAGGLVVSDDEAAAAMAVAFREFKLVLEPGGAVALAAALCGRINVRGRVVAVVASGGNVDAAVFGAALAKHGGSGVPRAGAR